MLASPWRESDGKPRRTISQYVAARRGRFFTLMPTMLLPRRKNDARMVKLTHWLSSVAAAAPEIPRPKVKMKIENRVEHDVQQPAGDEAAHREGRVPLRAQDVVHHEAAAHHGRAEQNPPRVGARVRKYRGRGAEQNHQRVDENSPTAPLALVPSCETKYVSAVL